MTTTEERAAHQESPEPTRFGRVRLAVRRAWPAVRRALPRIRDGLAGALVVFALILPDEWGQLTPASFVRIPVEGLVAAALLLALRGRTRTRRVVAVTLGVLLGLLTIVKIADIEFTYYLDRPFDVALDWWSLAPAASVLQASVGRAAEIGIIVGVIALVAAVLTVTIRSVLRLSSLAVRHEARTLRLVAALAVAWITLATLGVPAAGHGTATMAYQHGLQVGRMFGDQAEFTAQEGRDAFALVPGNELLQGLRGKDVLLTFVESYGRGAVEDPGLSPGVNAVLDQGTQALKAAGFTARSGFLTSSTSGGGSWLAHASLMSGLWINDKRRYDSLVNGTRFTLPRAFDRAGWRTVSVEPAISHAWPERLFYGYAKGYDRPSLSYHGPQFSYSPIPDQYTMESLHRAELQPGHQPLMAEITLTSSHTPFTPIPRLLDWNELGNGSVYAQGVNGIGPPGSAVLGNSHRSRDAYQLSIQYSLSTLISYIQHYGDNNLVMVFLGDHQPSPLVVGAHASRDVPITIVAKDPAVLHRIADWGWTEGLRPATDAPVWRMDTFRDRFLTAFAR